MTRDNVTPFHSAAAQHKEQKATPTSETNTPNIPPTLSIDQVLQEMDTWRKNKSTFNEPLPDAIWEKIFTLSGQHSLKRIRSVFGINEKRYKKKYKALNPPPTNTSSESTPPADVPPIEFCEVKTKHPIFEPVNIPTNTVLVELARADGKVMKIHMLSSRFIDIFTAFYTGDGDATHHAKA